MTQAGLKAGVVGGLVAAGLALLSLVPCLGCVALVADFVLYVLAGGLAGYWLVHPRTVGAGAGAGAIAGAVTALMGGVMDTIVTVLFFVLRGSPQAFLRALPPQTLRQLQELGIDPRIALSPAAMLGANSFCCLLGIVLAAVLGALGGAVVAALQSE